MKKVLKVLSVICVLQIAVSGCGERQFEMYRETINELTRDPKSRKLQGNENDLNDLRGCPVLFEMGGWDVKGRDQSWFTKDGIYHGTGIALDRSYKLSAQILLNQNIYLVYLGPWQPITLTHTEGSFLNSKKITEEKLIRFFAYSGIGGGPITYQYESQTEENKNIPEKPFSLSPTSKYAPDKFSLCVVKWTAKYGYNAVADLHPNPWFPFFTREYLTGSGKIIDSETGKIIADETGKIIETKE